MGKRREESVLNPGSQKRQRREHTDVHSDESNEEETLELSANGSASSQSVSSLKSRRDEDIRKVLCLFGINVLDVGISRTKINQTRDTVCEEDFCMRLFLPYFFWIM